MHTGVGSYGTTRLTVKYDSGLVGGRWGLSARYSKVNTDGYRDQSWVDSWNYYLALARYGERSRLRVTLFGGPEQTHLAYVGVPQAALDGQADGRRRHVDRRTNPLTYPGEIDNFFQPHYQVVHDLTISPKAKLSQTAYVFLGDGYYDQFRADRTLGEYDLPNVALPGGEVIDADRPGPAAQRRRVGRRAGCRPSRTRRAAGALDAQGEVRIHRAHHDGTVTWAQSYPTGVSPDHPTTTTGRRRTRWSAARRRGTPSRRGWRCRAGCSSPTTEYGMSDDQLKGVTLDESYNFALPRFRGGLSSSASRPTLYVGVARGMREPFFRSIYDPQDYYSTPVSLDPEDVWNVESGISVQRARGACAATSSG